MTVAQQNILMDRIQVHEGWYEGSRSYRNNNPGNITAGSFTERYGAVGSDGRFAIFASYDDGRYALRVLLFNTRVYPTLTVEEAIARYAPASENDVEVYVLAVVD